MNLKHFLCTIRGPCSSYSAAVIHICWKVLREASMEPPIQTEYFLSGGAKILNCLEVLLISERSLWIRFSIWGNIVVPPDKAMLVESSLRTSISHFWIDSWIMLEIPLCSMPNREGLKRHSVV